jgi:hypothetical protein
MPNIEEMKNNMTIFYSKSNGSIKGAGSGIQNMNIYGDDAEDYSLIWDFIVLPIDDYVIKNVQLFKINVNTKNLEMIPQENNYLIATN